MTKDSQRRFPENSDRWQKGGLFPSATFAGLKQITKRNNGSTVFFDGSDPDSGYVVGDGSNGFTLTRKQFYSTLPLETHLHGYLVFWQRQGYDGFGTWFNSDTNLIYIDPVSFVEFRAEARSLTIERRELAFYDIEGNQCLIA